MLSQFNGLLGVKLKFRTFAPDAVILLLASADSASDYCGIFLNGGKLQGNVVIDGYDSVLVESGQTYNTGNWYEVS